MFDFHKIRKILEKCWCKETSYFGKEGSRGQCYVTALVIQDLFGGDILTGVVNNEKHYWNCLPDGTELDFTSDQYGGDGLHPIIEGKKAKRLNRKNKRYLLLKKKFELALNEN